jgi:hypothetical protein
MGKFMTSLFHNKQYAEDWGFLKHTSLPTNLDGLTERRGHFLLCEVKRGEEVSEGQRIMLDALARQDKWTVLIVYSRRLEPGEFNERPVVPWAYEVIMPSGEKECRTCTPEEFKTRYASWFKTKSRNEWL